MVSWPKSARLQSPDQAGVYQKAVETTGFRAALASVEHPLATKHDALLLVERGIERNAGGFQNHQWEIRPIDGVHDSSALDGVEVDRVDRVVGFVVARIVVFQLLAEAGGVEIGIEKVR